MISVKEATANKHDPADLLLSISPSAFRDQRRYQMTSQTSSDANSSICLAQIVHTMLSLWSLTQTGYCAVHVIKKGNAVALCELGQVGKEVNTCLCQQNDVI